MPGTGENEGEDTYDRLDRMFPKYPNLHADISSLTQINRLGGLNKALAQPEFKGRLVYGTDWPLQFFPLVSSFYQVGRIPLKEMWRISRIKNTWDKDVELKHAIGVPTELFVEARQLLNIDTPAAMPAPVGPELEAPTLEDPEMAYIMSHADE